MSFKGYDKPEESTIFPASVGAVSWTNGGICIIIAMYFYFSNKFSYYVFRYLLHLVGFFCTNICLSNQDVCFKPTVSIWFCVPSCQSLESRLLESWVFRFLVQPEGRNSCPWNIKISCGCWCIDK